MFLEQNTYANNTSFSTSDRKTTFSPKTPLILKNYTKMLLSKNTSSSNFTDSLKLPRLISSDDEYLTTIISTYVAPPVIIFTLFTNSIICLILLRKNMRNPTNILLVFIAISDMVTGLLPLPNYIYFYILGNYLDWVPYSWCFFFIVTSDAFPTVFHTASIWLTVVLAIQRYFFICKPTSSQSWCTVSNAIKMVVLIYLLSFLSQLTRFLEFSLNSSEGPSKLNQNVNVSQCLQDLHEPFKSNINLYYNTYWSLRVVLVHLIPCSMLVILNGLLVKTLKNVQKRKKQLFKQNRRSECRRMAEANMTTLMLVVVVAVFLAVELPLALLFIVMMIDNTLDLEVFSTQKKEMAQTIINLAILLSYPFNFFIYCAMSKIFRSAITDLLKKLCCRKEQEDNGWEQKQSCTNKNKKKSQMTELEILNNGKKLQTKTECEQAIIEVEQEEKAVIKTNLK